MRYVLLPVISSALIVWIGISQPALADTPAPVTSLMADLQKAAQSQSLEAMKACFDMDGCPQALIDITMNTWQEYFNLNDKTRHYSFAEIKYMSLADALANDKTENPKAIAAMSQPRKMGDTTYEPNLKVIGFITISFKQGGSSVGSVCPVGITQDGTAKLVMSRPIK